VTHLQISSDKDPTNLGQYEAPLCSSHSQEGSEQESYTVKLSGLGMKHQFFTKILLHCHSISWYNLILQTT